MARTENYLARFNNRRIPWSFAPVRHILEKRREPHKPRQSNPRGKIVKENHHTVWMRLRDGNIIKRHRVKHGVGA